MSLLQLVWKNMRQRSLSTVLTLLSVALGVALAIALIVTQREAKNLFGQRDFGYDLVVGDRGSKLQLVLNMVYGIDMPPGIIPYAMAQDMSRGEMASLVKWAVPVAATDSLEGFGVLATTPAMLGYDETGQTRLPEEQRFQYRLGRSLELAEGRAFHERKFEAVLGSNVAATLDLNVGDDFQVTHGKVEAGQQGDVHDEKWTVVGILDETSTMFDDKVLQSYQSSLALGAHGGVVEAISQLRAEGKEEPPEREFPDVMANGGVDHEYYVLDPATGLIYLKLDPQLWQISGIYVATRSGFSATKLNWQLDNGEIAMAASPADVMIDFFDQFLAPIGLLLLLLTVLVSVLSALSILVSIYNSVSARRREMAILRSLGATRVKLLTLITVEAALIGLAGAIFGWLLGHLLSAGASAMIAARLGEGFSPWTMSAAEWYYVAAVVVMATLAGLVPALKAYSTPVADHLSD